MSTTLALRRIAAILALATATLAGPASAQCLITGPEVMCGGPVTLCGPDGNFEYRWSSFDGTLGTAQCLQVTQAGSYALEVFDIDNGEWFGPCYQYVAAGGGPVTCAITGPSSACEGESVTLCGPAGDLAWSWSGPGGFAANTACVTVSVPGTYRLTVRDLAGCSVASCAQDVAFTACRSIENCPRPPAFWSRQCAPDDDRPPLLDDAALAALGACVSERSALFEWSDPRAGLCATLIGEGEGLRGRAKRQLAGVWANVCSGALGLDGGRRASALDPDAAVELPLYRGTVGGWLAQAESDMAAVEGRRMRDAAARAVWQRVITVGWSLNHGQGLASVCSAVRRGGAGSTASPLHRPAGDTSLEQELSESLAPSLALGAPSPNPTRDATSLAFAVHGSAEADVDIAVHDLAGRRLRTLVHARLAPGEHVVRWDGRDDSGAPVRGGMYFVTARLGDQRVDTRVTLLR